MGETEARGRTGGADARMRSRKDRGIRLHVRKLTVIATVALVLAAGQSVATIRPVAAAGSECELVTGNLVADCGFEIDTTGWSVSGATGYVDTDGSVARTGSYGLLAFPPASQSVSLSQTLATTAGRDYEVRFYLWHGGSIASPSFEAKLTNGDVSSVPVELSNAYYGYWQPFTFGFSAAGASATLTFTFFGSWEMDDVSVYEPLVPTVTSQPASATAIAGAEQQFSAAASGAYLPTVQWQQSTDGGTSWSEIAGATSRVLSVTAAYALSDRQYRAVFTNGKGSAASNSATLTVVPPAVTGLSGVIAQGRISVSFTPAGDPAPTHFQCLTSAGKGWVACASGDALKGSAKTISVRASWDGVDWGEIAKAAVAR